ncbi:MAG: hypothetical protein Q4A92_12075 [Corynebacterium sp.]|nr:hypothetical protein [Corynebacterium sp.]
MSSLEQITGLTMHDPLRDNFQDQASDVSERSNEEIRAGALLFLAEKRVLI